MTHTEAITAYYGLVIQSLMRDAHEAYHARAGECEPVTAARLSMCQERKRDMLAQARAAGLLD